MKKRVSLGLALVLLGASASAAHAIQAVPPQPITRIDAVYPPNEHREVDVAVIVVVSAEGKVVDAEISESAGQAFDDAALAAARKWTFKPAMYDEKPVRAKIRLGFHFDAPTALPKISATSATPKVEPKVDAKPDPGPTAEEFEEVTVRGRSHIPSRGGGDYEISVGKLALVPHSDAASLLRLAPGTFLTNEGGTGHPYQIFLRGFDAREGQDVEFTLDGTPINEIASPHGNGVADTHFIIPEVVQNLRVLEGPFAPQQGNFAVAGSALYDVGVSQTGLTAQGTYGSFNTQRLLLMYRPKGSGAHTFGAAEAFTSDGYGQNRASKRATAMGGYEGTLGKTGTYRLLLTSYVTHYQTAGVLRADDVDSGKKGFFDTYDNQQGGDSSRHGASIVVEDRLGDTLFSQSAFLVLRDFRLRENNTGFLNDPQETSQSPHAQRGDLIDQNSHTLTFGGRGSARWQTRALNQKQELEFGYLARYDSVQSTQQRDRFETTIPYRKDFDLDSGIGNLGMHVDASIRPLVPWITVRGGGRIDFYSYRVKDNCAQRTQASIQAVTADTECFTSDRTGYRSADQTSSTSAGFFEPRASVLLGPFESFTFSGSYGLGSRSVDPQYVNQNLETPFAKVKSGEVGVTWQKTIRDVDLLAKSVFFRTEVDKDLFFNQTEGRATLANGTTRTGWSANARATGGFFDLAGSATLVRAAFDDTHLLIPYAPAVVLRADGALFGDLPFQVYGHKLSASGGLGVSYVGERPLPYGERSDTIFTVDLAANLKYRNVQFGLSCTNLLDRRYRLAEFNYASDFHSQAYPSNVAARHFVAGEPRAVYGTLTFTFGGEGT